MFRKSPLTSQKTQQVPVTKTNPLIVFVETIAVYCENHMQQINTLCEQNAKFFNVNKDGKYSYHAALNDEDPYCVTSSRLYVFIVWWLDTGTVLPSGERVHGVGRSSEL
jgi:hypothetical protein